LEPETSLKPGCNPPGCPRVGGVSLGVSWNRFRVGSRVAAGNLAGNQPVGNHVGRLVVSGALGVAGHVFTPHLGLALGISLGRGYLPRGSLPLWSGNVGSPASRRLPASRLRRDGGRPIRTRCADRRRLGKGCRLNRRPCLGRC